MSKIVGALLNTLRIGFRQTLSVVALLTLCVVARAGDAEANADARGFFERGLSHVRRGEFGEAIEAFERAQQIKPNYLTLYNLGLAYASAGRSSAAVATLERFLAESAERVDAARRGAVESLLAELRTRLGRVTVVTTPPDAELIIDGKLRAADAAQPFDLDPGTHVVAARRDGFEPAAVTLEIRPGANEPLTLSLKALPVPAQPRGRPKTQIRVQASLPRVGVFLDGRYVARTPVSAPLVVGEGPHVIRCELTGYLPQLVMVETDSERVARVDCVMPVDPRVLREHEAKVSRRRRRIWASALGVGAACTGTAAAVIYGWNSSNYKAWQSDGWHGGDDRPSESAIATSAAQIQRTDDIAIGLALVAGTAALSAGLLWVSTW